MHCCRKSFFLCFACQLTFCVGQHCVTMTLGPNQSNDTGFQNISRMRLFLAIASKKEHKPNLTVVRYFQDADGRQKPTSVTQHCEPRLLVIKCFSSRADALIVCVLLFFFFPAQVLKVQVQKLACVDDIVYPWTFFFLSLCE